MLKRRETSFFGMHFDFHASEESRVGEALRPDVVARFLDAVQPDYVQVDTKGHPGYSSYPTRVGNPAPQLLADPLKMWRELTAARGILLIAHHSGVFDKKAMQDHPDWAVVDENGVVSDSHASVFGPYADELLIPQLIEMALEWKLDGAWVDGECWAVQPDYSHYAQAEWEKEHTKPMPKSTDPDYPEYLAFLRKGFQKYVEHYIAAVAQAAPQFQITSNWFNSAYIPEQPSQALDFLSGDYQSFDAVNTARVHGRFLACQDKPWDLMAWGFNHNALLPERRHSTKEPVQLKQEAAFVLAQGGGFQIYNPQYGFGSTVQEWSIPIWAEAAQFVREREPYCKGAKLVPQVGILMPTEAHWAGLNVPFACDSTAMLSAMGLIHLAQDCGYSSEILETHHIEKFKDYPVIVLAHSTYMHPETIAALHDYVANGGHLLVASPDASALMGFEMTAPTDRLIHLSDGQRVAPLFTRSADFTGTDEGAGEYYLDNYMHDGAYAAAVQRGNVVALGFDLGNAYPANRTPCIRSFFKAQMARLFPQPLVTVEGSSYAELTITQREGKLYVHLLNYAGDHNTAGVRSYDEIPALHDLTVRIHTEKEPVRVTLRPEHRVWEGDNRVIHIDKLEVHTILEIEF